MFVFCFVVVFLLFVLKHIFVTKFAMPLAMGNIPATPPHHLKVKQWIIFSSNITNSTDWWWDVARILPYSVVIRMC